MAKGHFNPLNIQLKGRNILHIVHIQAYETGKSIKRFSAVCSFGALSVNYFSYYS